MRALITGTTSGIGRSIAQRLLANGDAVIAVNRRPLGDAERLAGAQHETLDITDFQQVRNLLRDLVSHGTSPDVFMLNAGINVPDNVGHFDYETFHRVMLVDLMGSLAFVGAALDVGLENRTFVAFSSTSNIVPNPGHIGYFIAKTSLRDVFRLLRKTDKHNVYKVAILGPVHSNIMRDTPPLNGLKKRIFDLLAVSSEKAAAALVDFSRSRSTVLNYPLGAVAFYHLVRVGLCFAPRLYTGTGAKAG